MLYLRAVEPGQDEHRIFILYILTSEVPSSCYVVSLTLSVSKSLRFNPGVFDSFPYPPWRTIAVHVGVGHFSVCPLAHSMLCLSFLLFSLDFYFSFSLPLPPFPSSLHCQTEMGETWVNGQVLICHPATKESITYVSHWEWEEGDSLVSHIHSLCSSSCPDVGIFLSSSLLPRIRMFNSHDVHAHSIQASPWHTGDLLRPISSLINAIGGMKKPHRQATVMCLFQLY